MSTTPLKVESRATSTVPTAVALPVLVIRTSAVSILASLTASPLAGAISFGVSTTVGAVTATAAVAADTAGASAAGPVTAATSS